VPQPIPVTVIIHSHYACSKLLASEHHHPLAKNKLYYMVMEAYISDWLAQVVLSNGVGETQTHDL